MRKLLLFAALSLPLAALAQGPADRLVDAYRDLAGSEANAKALVTGLREKSDIVLSPTVIIEPPTGPMGFGNIDIALSLTQASLNEQGIAKPTPEQLQASLLDVLDMRAGGMGWGEIAHALGFRLGELMRAERAQRPQRVAFERPERPARPERVHRPEKLERPQRAGR
jgi:hypothetical protein